MCSLLAALAAMLDFAFIGSVQPNAGVGLLFPVFAAVIIGGASLAGGQGTAVGTLSGALLLAIIANGLALLSAGSYLSNFVSGAVTIAAVVLDRFTQSLEMSDRTGGVAHDTGDAMTGSAPGVVAASDTAGLGSAGCASGTATPGPGWA